MLALLTSHDHPVLVDGARVFFIVLSYNIEIATACSHASIKDINPEHGFGGPLPVLMDKFFTTIYAMHKDFDAYNAGW